jgi:hypothetical protein
VKRLLVVAFVAVPSTTTVAAVAKRVAPREQPCEILEYGLYVPLTTPVRYADSGSVTGERYETDSVEFTKQTKTIAMERGRHFGIRYRLRDLPTNRTVDVKWRITYPRPIRKSSGWTFVEPWSASSSGELVQHVGYEFVYDWEMVAGDWKFQVFVDEQPACSFTFKAK